MDPEEIRGEISARKEKRRKASLILVEGDSPGEREKSPEIRHGDIEVVVDEGREREKSRPSVVSFDPTCVENAGTESPGTPSSTKPLRPRSHTEFFRSTSRNPSSSSTVSPDGSHPFGTPLAPLDAQRAALYVTDAQKGRSPYHLDTPRAVRLMRVRDSVVFRAGYSLVLVQILCLGFFETSCRENNCAAINISQPWVRVWELILLAAVAADAWMKLKIYGSHRVKKDPFEVAQGILIALTVVDVVLLWALEGADVDYHLRWTRPFRALHMINYSETMKGAIRQVLKTVPNVIDVAFIAIFFLLLWTTVCMVVFLRSDTVQQHVQYFPNYLDGLWNLMVCWTTANFPDVMIPAYNQSRWYALLFVVFLLVNLYIFMSLILAVIYNGYRSHLREDVLRTHMAKRFAHRRAWEIMKTKGEDGEYAITLPHFYSVLRLVRPSYSNAKIRLIYELLDVNEDGKLSAREWGNVNQLLNLRLIQEKAEQKTVVERMCPRMYDGCISRAVRTMVKHKYFDPIVDLLIVANGVQLAILSSEAETTEDLNNGVEYFFTAVFQLEILLKLYTVPWGIWWRSAFNRYDLVTVEVSVVGIILSEAGVISGWVSVSFMLLRVFRLLRLLGRIPRTRVIVSTLFRIIPVLRTFAAIQLSVFVFFCFVGMSAFGGGVTRDTVSPDTTWYKSEYYHNTFNTYAEGLVVCFELMVVNNWQVIVSGFESVYGRGVRIFFGLFYFVAVVVMLNIVVAFIIEAFTAEHQMANEKDDEEEEGEGERERESGSGSGSATARPEQVVMRRLQQRAAREKEEGENRAQEEDDTGTRVVSALWVAERKRKLQELMWYLFSEELQPRIEEMARAQDELEDEVERELEGEREREGPEGRE